MAGEAMGVLATLQVHSGQRRDESVGMRTMGLSPAHRAATASLWALQGAVGRRTLELVSNPSAPCPSYMARPGCAVCLWLSFLICEAGTLESLPYRTRSKGAQEFRYQSQPAQPPCILVQG